MLCKEEKKKQFGSLFFMKNTIWQRLHFFTSCHYILSPFHHIYPFFFHRVSTLASFLIYNIGKRNNPIRFVCLCVYCVYGATSKILRFFLFKHKPILFPFTNRVHWLYTYFYTVVWLYVILSILCYLQILMPLYTHSCCLRCTMLVLFQFTWLALVRAGHIFT